MTERIERHACFGGWQDVYRHRSDALGCDMTVGVYFPPQVEQGPRPVLYWLSGLTCNEQNFITKAGAQRYAAEHGIILVSPDTSPRGAGVADADRYDLGQGAGFYVDATQAPWAAHYRMQEYVSRELPAWVEQDLAASGLRWQVDGELHRAVERTGNVLPDLLLAAEAGVPFDPRGHVVAIVQ